MRAADQGSDGSAQLAADRGGDSLALQTRDRGGDSPARQPAGREDGGADMRQAGDAFQYTLAYPTGDRRTSIVLLEATGPGQARVGQPYNYNLRVTNLTDTPLHGVTIQNVGALPEQATPGTAGVGAGAGRSATTRPTEAARTELRSGGEPLWTIGTLGPKQSQTKQFSEVADEEGTIRNCLSVSYNPTLCVAVQVVKPELAVGKAMTPEALICQPIVATYRVTNTGSGVATGVVLEDTLPEGLQTAEGRNALSVNVGDLPAGQSKDVTANLRATRTGQFASRATARSAATTAQSRQVGTTVRQPTLGVTVEGPEAAYVGQAINYRVTVRNTGDASAPNAMLSLTGPAGQKYEDRNLGTIEAGAAKVIAVTTNPARGAGQTSLAATARAECAEAATNQAEVVIRTIPAIQVECIDGQDPVQIGQNTTYTVTVRNEGSGPDRNVRVTATLPPQLKYVRGGGASNVTVNGQNLVFGPVDTLAPNAAATWTIEATALQPADVQFVINVQTESVAQPVVETEPTKLFDPRAPANPANPAPANPANPVAPGNGPAAPPVR